MTIGELVKLIDKLKLGKAPGIDGIPVKIVKSAAHPIGPVLVHIFNTVYSLAAIQMLLRLQKLSLFIKREIAAILKITEQ